MFPLDNLTRVFMASFSRYISTLGGSGGPEKDRNVFCVALLELMFGFWGLSRLLLLHLVVPPQPQVWTV